MVKNLPVIQETWVQSLGWDDPMEKGVAIHSSILAWRIPWTEEPGRLQPMASQRAFDYTGHNNYGKFLKRWEYQTTLQASWEICMHVKKQPLEPDMQQQTGSKLGKEYVKYVSLLF